VQEKVPGEIGNIIVRASDTDIAIILQYHSPTFTATMLMDTGTNARNTRKYINLTAVGEVMGALLCESLPAFHAFTGCDYTSVFVRKGKKRPFAKPEKTRTYSKPLSVLDRTRALQTTTTNHSRHAQLLMYGAKQESLMPLNKFRYKVFQKAYGPKATAKKSLGETEGFGC